MGTENSPRPRGALSRAIKKFERFIVVSLIVMMMMVVALSTMELGWIIVKDIITPPILLLELGGLEMLLVGSPSASSGMNLIFRAGYSAMYLRPKGPRASATGRTTP